MRVLSINNQNMNPKYGANVKMVKTTPNELLPQVQNINVIKCKAQNLDLQDAFFDSLKSEYPEFQNWWKKIANRDVYVNMNNEGKINALLILKIEANERIDCNPALNFNRVLKICTIKVADQVRGLNIGKIFLQLAFDFAEHNNIEDIYFTHFCKEKDSFVDFVHNFGFNKYGTNSRGESVFVKKLTKDNYENLK